MNRLSTSEVERAVAALASLSRQELAARWLKMCGVPPPKGVQRGLLERAAAYQIQVKAFGGLSASARRTLAAIRTGNHRRLEAEQSALRPGTRLVREWHGTVHQVEVAKDGFLWKAERYRSLSAIARAITGAAWSGPRFFGL